MSENDGGPAFPVQSEQRYNDPIHGVIRPSDMYGETPHGMSLRDYFAGRALTGIIASHTGPELPLPTTAIASQCAYDFADAMLEARQK